MPARKRARGYAWSPRAGQTAENQHSIKDFEI
jgi:hypothetical protein